MAAAKALLAAAGFQNSTATEHATSASQSGSTARKDDSLLPLTGLPKTREVKVDPDFEGLEDNDIEKIVALLLWMSQDFQSDLEMNDIHIAALEVIIKQSDVAMHLLNTASVRKLSHLIDMMMLTKEGIAKDANKTLQFMRRVQAIRSTMLSLRRPQYQAFDNASNPSDNATEHVELAELDVSKCYQQFGHDLLTHDLLPHQKQDKRYRIQNKPENDTYLTGFQRSFTDNMLRKGLGDKRVAFRIWQYGIPSIADRALPFRRRAGRKIDMSMLQSGLNECLQWYICLANDIVVHQTQEGFDAQLAASSKDAQERQQQQTRREALKKAQDALRRGAALASQRDKGKRSYDDMDDDEQQLLEDYETGRTKRATQTKTLPKLKPFRSHDWVNG